LAVLMARWSAAAFLVLGLFGVAAARQQAVPAGRHIVLVSIDGFAAFHLDDPAIDLPNIRALAAAGTRAASSETVFPSVTHPSHTTLTTGVRPRRHGVVDNRVRDRRTGERLHITNLPRQVSIRAPTLFDAVHGRGWRTAAFFWPETKDDAAIDDNIAEVFTGENEMADPAAASPGLLRELREAGVPIDGFYDFYDDPFSQGAADLALTKAAAHVIAVRRPALTAVHRAEPLQCRYGADDSRSLRRPAAPGSRRGGTDGSDDVRRCRRSRVHYRPLPKKRRAAAARSGARCACAVAGQLLVRLR
jgi:hypothetical protein